MVCNSLKEEIERHGNGTLCTLCYFIIYECFAYGFAYQKTQSSANVFFEFLCVSYFVCRIILYSSKTNCTQQYNNNDEIHREREK